MPAYTNETGFPVLIIDTDGKAQEIADDGTFNSYFYYPDCTVTASTPNPLLKEIGEAITLEFNLTGKADDSVDDVDFPAPVMAKIQGFYGFLMEVVPGTGDAAPTSAFTISIANEDGITLYSEADLAVDANAVAKTNGTLSAYPMVSDSVLTLSCTDIGEDNTVKLIIQFV